MPNKVSFGSQGFTEPEDTAQKLCSTIKHLCNHVALMPGNGQDHTGWGWEVESRGGFGELFGEWLSMGYGFVYHELSVYPTTCETYKCVLK